MDSTPLWLDAHRRGCWLVLRACGVLDASTARVLRRRLTEALREHPLVVLDLTGCRPADASVLAVLVGAHRRALVAGKMFLIVAPDPQTRRMFQVTGLVRRLSVLPTFEEFLIWSGTARGERRERTGS